MKKICKRISAAALALAVLLTALVFDVPERILAHAAGTHTNHKVCGDLSCSDSSHENITWEEWTSDNALPTSGNYYLNTDVKLNGRALINGNLTLCLNGHTIDAQNLWSIFDIGSGSLTLCDCSNGKTGTLKGGRITGEGGGVFVGENGTFTMYGGTISGNISNANNISYGGGGVYVKGTFTMYGGTISGNTAAKNGGGVRVSANSGNPTFTMFGGNISGNTASCGGGVYVSGDNATFTMNGGTISGNTTAKGSDGNGGGVCVDSGAKFIMNDGAIISKNTSTGTDDGAGGGGVYVGGGHNAKFEMNGGTISGNTAYYGGGVFVGIITSFEMNGGTIGGTGEGEGNTAQIYGGGVYVHKGASASTQKGTFTMSDGSISGNVAKSAGGGVYLNNNSTFTMNKGTISGNTATTNGGGVHFQFGELFTINGEVNISGNTKKGGSADNVYLVNKTITIGNDFSTVSPIGVNTFPAPTSCTTPKDVTGAASDVSEHFKADISGQSIVYNGGKVQLIVAHNWGEWKITTDPSETDKGEATRNCTTTEEHTDTMELPELTDTEFWEKTTNDPTCTESGSDVYESEYGTVTVPIKAAGHETEHTAAKPATCIENGNVEYWYCSKCKKYFGDSECKTELATTVVTKTGHSAAKTEAKNPTCTDDGNKEYWYCSKCNKYFSDSECAIDTTLAATVITKLEHSFSTVWSTDGTNHWHACTRTDCTAVSDEAEHSFTLKSDGTNHWQECACGYTKDKEAHDFAKKYDDAKHWQQCTVCEYKQGEETHSYTEKSDDTCFWQECACGHITGKTEHTFTQKYDETNHWYECKVCEHKKGETAHTLTPNKNASEHWQECSCGYKEGITPHAWGKWSLTSKPAVNKTGTAERACSCGEKQTKSDIPKLTDPVWTKTEATKPTVTDNGEYTYTSDYGTVTVTVPKLSDPDVWTKTETAKPTVTDNGEYTYTSDYGTVTVTVPKLSDSDVWTKTETAKPTVSDNGEYTYTSDYGTVTVTVPKLSDPVWTKTETAKPTVTDNGEYTYTSDYGTVTVTVPKLTDSAWTKTETTKPTVTDNGKYTYTSDYGTVTVTVPKLSAPDVWTKTETAKPTVTDNGEYTYTSDYGTVTVTVPKLTNPAWTKTETAKPTVSDNGEYTYTSDYGTVTVTVPKLTDSAWTKTETAKPTVTNNGKYTYTSDYGAVTVTVPKLSDPDVWTKDIKKSTAPTEDQPGKDVYTSEYGEVEVILSKLPHTDVWGDWTITKAPTETKTGTAERTCTKNSEHKETIELPALSDTTVWTKDNTQHVAPTENSTGKDVYTSEYGEVEVTLPELSHTHTLTHVPEVPATETAKGVKEHWHCEGCGKDFSDENGKTEITDLTIPVIGHTHTLAHVSEVPATETAEGVKEHWHCEDCGKNFSDKDGTTEITDLTIPVIGHTHTLAHVPEVPATETTKGTKEHWYCEGCGKDFSDKDGTTEITDLTIPVIGHTHTLAHVPEVPATETSKGVKEHWHCEDCGKDFLDENGENEAAPDELKTGRIKKEVQSGENAPTASLTTPSEELINAVLTDKDQEIINNGADIKIILTIDDAANKTSSEDRAAVETAIGSLDGYKLGQYLDVNLLKVIGDQSENITETSSPLTITFDIPLNLRGSGRTFSIIRIHNGETTVLSDLDDDENTVTIKTDKFSIYALAYSEKTAVTPPDGNDPAASDENSSGSSGPNESSGSSDSDTTPPGNASGDNNNSNPSTGITISLVPLAMAVTVITAAIKRKKK